MKRNPLLFAGLLLVLSAGSLLPTAKAQNGDTVLKAAEAQKYLPATVFFRGQTAAVQMRNSGGVKFADGYFVLGAAVDTSGYSSEVQSKYQDYLITEVPITMEGHVLAPGAYGVGFIGGDKFIVLDIGGHDLFTVDSKTDGELKRPMPLMMAVDAGGGFRLYSGRRYVTFKR